MRSLGLWDPSPWVVLQKIQTVLELSPLESPLALRIYLSVKKHSVQSYGKENIGQSLYGQAQELISQVLIENLDQNGLLGLDDRGSVGEVGHLIAHPE